MIHADPSMEGGYDASADHAVLSRREAVREVSLIPTAQFALKLSGRDRRGAITGRWPEVPGAAE
jgi:hypothetical protein